MLTAFAFVLGAAVGGYGAFRLYWVIAGRVIHGLIEEGALIIPDHEAEPSDG